VNCCNPELNGGGGWGVFNSLFGWTNSATYGSVISYNLYWIAVIVMFLSMRYYEKKGHWPLRKPKTKQVDDEAAEKSSEDGENGVLDEKTAQDQGVVTTSTTREIPA
jgi:high-affinity iron transporter